MVTIREHLLKYLAQRNQEHWWLLGDWVAGVFSALSKGTMSEGIGKNRYFLDVLYCTHWPGWVWLSQRPEEPEERKEAGCVSHMTEVIGHMVLKQEKTCRVDKNVNTGGIWSIQEGWELKALWVWWEKKGSFDVEQIFQLQQSCHLLCSPK